MRRRLTQGSAGWLGRPTRPAGSRGWQPGLAYIHACMNARMHTRIHTNMNNMHNMPNMHNMQNMMHRCTICMYACILCMQNTLFELLHGNSSAGSLNRSTGRLGRPARSAGSARRPALEARETPREFSARWPMRPMHRATRPTIDRIADPHIDRCRTQLHNTNRAPRAPSCKLPPRPLRRIPPMNRASSSHRMPAQ